MPSSINGIGTTYYGKKNRQTRPGNCKTCNRYVNLESYDTRLWFIVFLVPIIPLGRKRITDYCPSCTKHFVADLDKWEAVRQQSVSTALQEYQATPTADKVINAHQQLIGFTQYQQAAEFRKIVQEKFAGDIKVQLYFGQVLAALGKPAEAARHFKQVLALDPANPEARVGVARDMISRGDVDGARKQVAFLEQPGASQTYSLSPLGDLATGYQKAGRHQEALDLYQKVITTYPTLTQHAYYRSHIQTSEKALKKNASILPKKKFSFRALFARPQSNPDGGYGTGKSSYMQLFLIIVAIIAGAILIMGGVNEYTRRFRPLYIVNAFDKPAHVVIDGAGDYTVPAHGRTDLTLSEGSRHVHITGPVDESYDFTIAQNYWDRFGSNALWLINVGGAALLMEKHSHYAEHDAPPTDLGFVFGQSFVSLQNVDKPFEELPSSVDLDSAGSTKTLVNLTFAENTPYAIYNYLLDHRQQDEAARLAEWELKLHPDDYDMLYTYASNADAKHLQSLLKEGLAHRPVVIDWHRIYQNWNRRTLVDNEALIAQYDAMLKNEPDNSALLYLRGRLSQDHKETASFNERALKVDPNNAFAIFGTGYQLFCNGDFKGALPLFTKASKLRPDLDLFSSILMQTRFALGDFAGAEEDSRATLKKYPDNDTAAINLIYALVAQSRPGETAMIADAWDKRSSRGEWHTVRFVQLYASKNAALMETTFSADKSPQGRFAYCLALIEQGKLDEAEKISPFKASDEDAEPFDDLARAAAWLLSGDKQHASPWLQRTVETLSEGYDEDNQQAAKFLTASTPPTREQVMGLELDSADDKALLAATLALQHPEAAKDFAGIAKQFNFELAPPHNLVERIVAKKE